ncbi:hypothetical protein, partial [Klebsiella aerogenes]|uniref:hypothetical protein n=1 Tax=Klebsiella aerogenes TaxID=548 RepID=UPI001CC3E24E
LDQDPSFTGATDISYDAMASYQGNQNSLSVPAILAKTFTGLSVGSHTVKIKTRGITNAANQPAIDINASTKLFVGKK